MQTLAHRHRPVGDAFILFQDAVIAGDGLSQVSHQWDVHGAEATLLPGCVDPIGNKPTVKSQQEFDLQSV